MRTSFKSLRYCTAVCLLLSLTSTAIEPTKHPENVSQTKNKGTDNRALMVLGGQLLRNSATLQAESISVSRHSNSLRKSLNKLQSQLSALPQGQERQLLNSTIDLFAQEIPLWQHQASGLRDQALTQRSLSLKILEQAYLQIWLPHIRQTGSLYLNDNDGAITAHNVKIRSIHPSKINMNISARGEAPASGMSFAVPAISGQNIPGALDLSSFQISRKLTIFAHVEPETATALVPLNQIHPWRLILSDLDGQPLRGAEIEIEGHMPGHVHGLPTQPQVTEEFAPGVYRVQGVKFQMPGWWVMTFIIRAQQLEDAVTFNIRL